MGSLKATETRTFNIKQTRHAHCRLLIIQP